MHNLQKVSTLFQIQQSSGYIVPTRDLLALNSPQACTRLHMLLLIPHRILGWFFFIITGPLVQFSILSSSAHRENLPMSGFKKHCLTFIKLSFLLMSFLHYKSLNLNHDINAFHQDDFFCSLCQSS